MVPLAEKFVNWAKRNNTKRKQIAAFVVGAILVPVGMPLLISWFGSFLDASLRPLVGTGEDLLDLLNVPADIILGGIMGGLGLCYALWAIIAEYQIGHGTPIPVVPTQKLVIVGPYKNSRNPMTFGTIFYLLGIAVLLHSTGSLLVVFLIIFLPLVAYIKLIEEKELVARFGDAYAQYRRTTSFMFPLPKRTNIPTLSPPQSTNE